jgi:nitroimidazol reductase NimA-like FMN-containing flavoprotein (pyridoxamine 5'-phosphate oxidase superfamily)
VELEEIECRRRLASRTVGRVAATVGALPTIVPVVYAMVDDRVVFGVAPDSPLIGATRNTVIAFQVDQLDPSAGECWSVQVTGIACPLDGVTGTGLVERGPDRHLGGPIRVQLDTDFISGHVVAGPLTS